MRTRPYNLTSWIRPALVALLALAVSAAVVGATSVPAGAQSDTTITPDGIGAAVLGSTIEELTSQLGPDYTISDEVRITVDFHGYVISRDGQVQFRAVKADEPGDELSLFIISNDDYQTAEGVGPGTSIADAEDTYGAATLSINPDQESREFIRFTDHPHDRMAFRTQGIGDRTVGTYGDGDTETTDYEPDAMIAAVWLSCVPGTDCPADLGDDAADDDAADPAGETTDDDDDTSADPDAADDDAGDDAADDDAADDDAGDDAADDDVTDPAGETTDDDAATTGGSTGDQGGQLPQTGTEEMILVAAAGFLFLLGGMFVLFNRRYLAPAWLGSRRW